MPVIRRNNCIYAALGTCYSVWMAVWYAGWNSTKCRINTVVSPDDRHTVAPKHVEKRKEHTKKNCAQSWLYLQDDILCLLLRALTIQGAKK